MGPGPTKLQLYPQNLYSIKWATLKQVTLPSPLNKTSPSTEKKAGEFYETFDLGDGFLFVFASF